MRILAIDVGEKKIGLAVGETTTGMAFARPACLVSSWSEAWPVLIQLVTSEQAERIVVGWPLNYDGTVGPQALRVEEFIATLSQHTKLPIDKQDERGTSQAVQREHVGRQLPRGAEDSLAAQMILESYLQAHHG